MLTCYPKYVIGYLIVSLTTNFLIFTLYQYFTAYTKNINLKTKLSLLKLCL